MTFYEYEEEISNVWAKYAKWIWQEKHNGERALIHIRNGKVIDITNRNGNSRMADWNEIKSLKFDGIAPGDTQDVDTILDCEVCVFINGKSVFYGGINQRKSFARNSMAKEFPLRTIVFDIIRDGKSWLINTPYKDRLKKLRDEYTKFEGEHFEIVKDIEKPENYWEKVMIDNREGLVIKNPEGKYYLGKRTREWLKVKCYKQADFIIDSIETNNKGAKLSGHGVWKGVYAGMPKSKKTGKGITFTGHVQWSSCGWEKLKVGDSITAEFLDINDGKMIQPHKCAGQVIE
jgi:ATP-dependent DNA ligase